MRGASRFPTPTLVKVRRHRVSIAIESLSKRDAGITSLESGEALGWYLVDQLKVGVNGRRPLPPSRDRKRPTNGTSRNIMDTLFSQK